MDIGIVDQKIIACACPYFWDSSIYWHMIFSHKIGFLVDLRSSEDLQKRAATFGNSYPPFGKPFNYSDMLQVENIGTSEENANYCKVVYKVSGLTYDLKDKIERQVTCLHYRKWLDGRTVPLSELDFLVSECRKAKELLIHCIGGVGRTGTLITALALHNKISSGELHPKEFNVQDLKDLLYKLRKQRSDSFVGEVQQFDLLYQYAKGVFAEQNSSSVDKFVSSFLNADDHKN